MNVGYFAPVIYRAYARSEAAPDEDAGEAPVAMVLAMVLPAVAVLVLFFYADALVQLIERIG